MKSTFAILFVLISSLTLRSQCHKINFVNTPLTYAYEKAQNENKSIFIFIYDENDSKADFFQSAIFYKPEICTLFNEKYVNIKAPVKSAIGKEIQFQYQITDFPSFILLDKNRFLIRKTNLIGNTADLLNFANRL